MAAQPHGELLFLVGLLGAFVIALLFAMWPRRRKRSRTSSGAPAATTPKFPTV